MLRSLFADLSRKVDDESATVLINDCRLIAIDGSQVSLPRTPSTLATFGQHAYSKTSHQPQSRLIVAWDVLARRPVDWVTGSCFASERAATIHMAPRLPERSVVLLDRGFHGTGALHAFTEAGIGCFMRVRSGKSTWLAVQRFLAGRPKDLYLDIEGEAAGATVTLSCRAVKTTRINARTGAAETVVFLTNLLDRERWPRALLLKLYSLRWDIETSFRELKIQDRIEGFHSTSAAGIQQEISVYMIARLLAGMLLAQAASNAPGRDLNWDNPRKHVFNNCSLIHATADIVIAYMRGASRNDLGVLFAIHVRAIRDSAQRRRPKRSYIRKCKGRYGRWKGTKNHQAYNGRNAQIPL